MNNFAGARVVEILIRLVILGERPQPASEAEVRNWMSLLSAICLWVLALFHFEQEWQGLEERCELWMILRLGRTAGFYGEMFVMLALTCAFWLASYFALRQFRARWLVVVGIALFLWLATEIVWRSIHV